MTSQVDTPNKEPSALPEPDGADHGNASSLLTVMLERIEEICAEVAELNRRAAHRELVIDRLHEENREHRGGIRRTVLEPVVADLIRLYDVLMREAGRVASNGSAEDPAVLLTSFADEVELILDRCGIECYRAEPGDAFRGREHSPLAVVATDETERHNTVAEVISTGFRDRETGKVRRPVRARFYQYQRPGEDE